MLELQLERLFVKTGLFDSFGVAFCDKKRE